MTEQFNQLTPAESERLYIVSEEMTELIKELCEANQIICKILRHGYESHHPDNPLVSNKELLEKELGDVIATISLLFTNSDVDEYKCYAHSDKKLESLKKWVHHQKPTTDNPDNDYINRQGALFDEYLESLLPEYEGKYVLFEEGKVYAVGESRSEVAMRAYAVVGMRPLFIEQVLRKENGS